MFTLHIKKTKKKNDSSFYKSIPNDNVPYMGHSNRESGSFLGPNLKSPNDNFSFANLNFKIFAPIVVVPLPTWQARSCRGVNE